MIELREIMAAFEEAAGHLDRLAIDALIDHPSLSYEDVVRLKQVNNGAYFMLVFARFESTVNELVKKKFQDALIVPAHSMDPARDKIILGIHRRLPFMERMALLLDQSSSEYEAVRKLYAERNAIAHHGTPHTDVNVRETSSRLLAIAAKLQDAP